MSPYEFISHFITLGVLFITVALVALKNINSRLNRNFIAFALVLAIYLAINFAELLHLSYSTELNLARSALLDANFVPTTFYLFVLSFIGSKSPVKWFGRVIYILPFVLAPLAFAHANIGAVKYSSSGVSIANVGPLLWLTLIYFFFAFGIAFWLLFKHYKKSAQTTRSQIKLIVYSSGIVILINMVTQIALPEFNINSYGNLIGIPSIVIFVGSLGYSILRQRLFDIRYAIIRTAAFASTMFLVLLSFSFLLLVPFRALFPSLNLPLDEKIYFIAIVLMLAFSFRYFTRFFQKITDKLFYQGHYNSQEVITEVGQVLASEIQLDSLSQKIREILAKRLKIQQVDIVVLDNGVVYYEAGNYFPKLLDKLSADLNSLGDDLLTEDELLDGDKKTILRRYGINIFEVLKTRNEKVGYLLFSEKMNGTSYNTTDLKLIEIVSDELAIAIQNSRSYSQIQRFNVLLQNRIDEATNQLKAANEELKKQDAVKDDFISMISHQLGNPLAVIDGFLTNTVEGLYGNMDHKLNDVLSKTLARTRMMKALVSDLLNISRMDAGKFYLELTKADMIKIVSEEVEALNGEAQERKVQLTFHEPKMIIPVLIIDEPKTRQAVMNLISNGLRYASGGHVNVYLDSNGETVTFKVVDDGIGVPEEVKPKLFSKFFRAENAREKIPDGTGIGLYLVKRVVDDQKGKLIFESQVNKGSTFGFELPLNSDLTPGTPQPIGLLGSTKPARERQTTNV